MNETSQDSAHPAIEELVDAHGRMVHGAAYRILGNPEDAEDVFQDIFLKVAHLRGWGRFGAVRDWGAFLRVMTTRRSLDVARRNRTRSQVVSVDWIEELEQPSGKNPRQEALQEERARLMRQAVTALPRREALVLSLYYFEDLTCAEIAKHLDLSPNAIGVLLYRARHHLRALLQPVLWPERPLAGLAPAISTARGDHS